MPAPAIHGEDISKSCSPNSNPHVSFAKRFFWFCSGADLTTLQQKECLTDHNKYAAIGSTVFLTSILAVISASYTLHLIWADYLKAIGFGIVWGVVILNLDRLVVLSIKNGREGIAKRLFTASPRLFLSIILSLVITMPLELKIFDKEITDQIADTMEKANAEDQGAISKRFSEISILEERNKALTKDMDEIQNQKSIALRDAASIERTEDARRLRRRYISKINREHYNLTITKLNARSDEYDKEIKDNNKRIADLKQKQDEQTEEKKTIKQQSVGLLMRIEALHDLAQRRSVMGWSILLIGLLFVILESAPVLVKLISEPGAYEAVIYRMEQDTVLPQAKAIEDLKEKLDKRAVKDEEITDQLREFESQEFDRTIETVMANPQLTATRHRMAHEIIKGLEQTLKRNIGHTHPYTNSQDAETANAAEAARAFFLGELARETNGRKNGESADKDIRSQMVDRLKL
jgi:hypothetical protein